MAKNPYQPTILVNPSEKHHLSEHAYSKSIDAAHMTPNTSEPHGFFLMMPGN